MIGGKEEWMSGGGGEQRQKNKQKESRRWRYEKEAVEAEEERKDPNACEMKRIKGLHTSSRGKKDVWGKKND